jgi:cytochrome c556
VYRISFVLLAAAGIVAAQQVEEMTEWMKAAGQTSDRLRKAEKKTGPEIVTAAERLGGIYEQMIGFWRQRGPAAEDAVKLSMQGKNAASELASAAKAGDEAKAAEAIKGIGGTCKACHDTHRERIGENKYRIK